MVEVHGPSPPGRDEGRPAQAGPSPTSDAHQRRGQGTAAAAGAMVSDAQARAESVASVLAAGLQGDPTWRLDDDLARAVLRVIDRVATDLARVEEAAA